jgi:hypothetical protein
VARRWKQRTSRALRAAHSLEGLAATLVGGAVGAIVGGALSQLTDFRLGPTIAVSGGFGLLAAAAFLWRLVRPRRDREAANLASRRPRLKKLLRDWATEGEFIAELPADAKGPTQRAWRNDVRSLVADTLGSDGAEAVFKGGPPAALRAEARRLRALADDLDSWPLRDFDFDHLPQP